MYLYETHCHTAPVSKCARATVRQTLEFYKSQGYRGVFITNHFIDGNVNADKNATYKELLDFYFSDYKEGKMLEKEIGIDVFLGVETSYRGTDFLIYGLSVDWWYAHPEIMEMKKSEQLAFMREEGALVIHAHPFREAKYIDHIRLFPRAVDGVEIFNACRTDFENEMAKRYADNYGLLYFGGTDNHVAGLIARLGGIRTTRVIRSESQLRELLLDGRVKPIVSREVQNNPVCGG